MYGGSYLLWPSVIGVRQRPSVVVFAVVRSVLVDIVGVFGGCGGDRFSFVNLALAVDCLFPIPPAHY